MMRYKKLILILPIFVLIFVILIFPVDRETFSKPMKAKDTDGTPSDEIIKNMENGYETVILKFFPFGYLEVEGWEKVNNLKKAYAIADWKTYKDLGAGNIYMGYSFDGKTYNDTGPFNESESVKTTIIEIPVNPSSDLSKLVIRFRGEDLDFAIDAIAEVKIRLKVINYNFGLFS